MFEDKKAQIVNIPNADHLDYDNKHIKDVFIPFLYEFSPNKNNKENIQATPYNLENDKNGGFNLDRNLDIWAIWDQVKSYLNAKISGQNETII